MNSKLREKAVKLRLDRELSYSAIQKMLGVPKSTLSYWLKDYPLSENKILELRQKGWKKGEASRERYRNTMREKRKRELDSIYEQEKKKLGGTGDDSLYVAGLMLYLGEGSKKDNYRVSVSNTDPLLIRFFIKWVRDFLLVPRSRIKAQLHLYENMDIAKETKFWKNELGLEDSQLYKTQVRKLRKSSFTYRESFRHGTCQVSCSGREIKARIMMGIKAFCDLYLARHV